jgi:hypothetical protein
MVAELSGHDRKCWDLEALDMNLITLDAVAVTRIPLGHGEEDCWSWSAQRHGCYSVKSEHRLLSEKEQQHHACKESNTNLSINDGNVLWRKLWKLDVPPQVRVFDLVAYHRQLCTIKSKPEEPTY